MQENLNLFDFELDAEDMQKIAELDTTHSLFLDHHSGETTKDHPEDHRESPHLLKPSVHHKPSCRWA